VPVDVDVIVNGKANRLLRADANFPTVLPLPAQARDRGFSLPLWDKWEGVVRKAAHKALATSELQLVLALPGTAHDQGMAALHEALGDDVLRPHFAAIEAKRLARDGATRKAVRALLGKDAVMSASEKAKLGSPRPRRKPRA